MKCGFCTGETSRSRATFTHDGHSLRRMGACAETATGSLKIGKSADLAIVALPERDEKDPFALLLESELPVVGTMFEGDFVSGQWLGN